MDGINWTSEFSANYIEWNRQSELFDAIEETLTKDEYIKYHGERDQLCYLMIEWATNNKPSEISDKQEIK
tara:strand:+ start:404 stop:613 length:210 start_codon:yes stop_codon:yes gene_type:complete